MNFRLIIQSYIQEFHKSGEIVLKNICNLSIPSQIVFTEYKKLTPIDGLPLKEKNELWEYAKETYPDGDKETRMRFVKITYTIGTLI